VKLGGGGAGGGLEAVCGTWFIWKTKIGRVGGERISRAADGLR